MKQTKIMLIAGDTSGDKHAADLITALKYYREQPHFYGLGGSLMHQAGLVSICPEHKLGIFGIVEVIKSLFTIRRIFNATKNALKFQRPDLLILVDYGGFNLKVAAVAHKLGIKILYYISPQIWASRAQRIHKIKRYINHMAVILPFEAAIYRQYKIPTTYVGSPLVEQITACGSRLKARTALLSQYSLEATELLISLAPGSRESEVTRLMPILVASAQKIHASFPHCQFIVPVSSSIEKNSIAAYFADTGIDPIFTENNYLALEASDVVIGASGTLTLECAILGTPIIVIYKTNYITYKILKQLIKVPYIAMCNIIARELVAPEFIQNDASAYNIFNAANKLLTDTHYYQKTTEKLAQVKQQLGTDNAAHNTAAIAVKLLDNKL
jgi:lipid-A-disaccharide synthase